MDAPERPVFAPLIQDVSILINGVPMSCLLLAHYASAVPAIRDEVIKRLVASGFLEDAGLQLAEAETGT